ncbi:hypothetical protein [Leuconostoc lactis]|uniref:hypothetical protein n=1 Tax=Leuconostoc lactis TaxID=1246 RepID=UPI0015F5BAD7|nr:hypothetical protein [Leuconostoc lactis]MBA5812550.1 hypothetical protein [Leuconostoc lactis]MBU7538330.1 hypothetical protein [Leuconostoc lactis]MDI6574008.1 hypothetical protein [Leuconostoc lactis]
MKKLVKKIALPGAILAFAMVLFGVSAYAGETFKLWEQHTAGRQYEDDIRNSINELATRIQTLKGQVQNAQTDKTNLENVLKQELGTSDVSDVNKIREAIQAKDRLIQQLNGIKENLERDKENLEKSKKDLEDSKTSTNTAEHNREIEKAENAMSRLREHAVNTKDRQDLQVPVQ